MQESTVSTTTTSSSFDGIINTTNNDDSNATLHHYNPQIITRYIQFYKGNTNNNNNNDDNTVTTTTTKKEEAPPITKRKKAKRKSKKHIAPLVLQIRREIQFCCKDNDLVRALHVFRNALQGTPNNNNNNNNNSDGGEESTGGPVRLEPQSFYNLLNLCDGSFGGGGVHVGTPKTTSSHHGDDNDDDTNNDGKHSTSTTKHLNNNNNNNNITLHQRLHHARQIHHLLKQLNIPCIEPAYTALIRLAVRVGNYDLATEYLDDAEGTQQCKVKLRMYSSLLRGYCGDLSVEEVNGVAVATTTATGGDGGGGGTNTSSSRSETKKPTQEGLIQALKVWKRMYDNSGGISTGHPRYQETKKQATDNHFSSSSSITAKEKMQKQQQLLLFGEGVSPKISLSEYEYSALLKCATALKDVKVAERVLSDIAESVMVPGLSTMEVMLDWFRSDYCPVASITTSSAENTDSEMNTCTTTTTSALDHVTLPPREGEGLSVGPITNDTGNGWNIYRDCTIDTSTGLLQLCHPEVPTSSESSSQQMMIEYRLKPVELTQKAWKAMREMNSSIVLEGTVEGNISVFQGGGKGKKRPRGSDVVSKLHDGTAQQQQQQVSTAQKNDKSKNKSNNNNNNNNGRKSKDPNWRINHWKEFENFIENHPPYNICIDGANVGYYNQTYRLGSNAPRHVDYKQIDGLVRHLLELPSNEGHHIILFMHERHFSQRLLPHWAHPIIKMWDGNVAPYDRLTLYRTPQGLNDDWYWMHAALINGGREDKPSVLVITNDEMRDHHFQMTAQGYFLRWKERHQVHFDFGEWNRELKRNDVLLEYPSIYSRRIQRVDGENVEGVVAGADAIVIPLPKKGDENRFVDGVHVADDGIPLEETYVVVQRVTS